MIKFLFLAIILTCVVLHCNSLQKPCKALLQVDHMRCIDGASALTRYDKLGKIRGGSKSFHDFAAVLVNSAVDPSISGGILSGGLHAVSGPDHLAAILPSSFGYPAWIGIRIGAVWGLGHGLSAISLGLAAYFLKDRLSSQFAQLSKFSVIAELAIGLSLLIIGVNGVKESMVTNSLQSHHLHRHHQTAGGPPDSHSITPFQFKKSLFFNGLLHGLSWDGAPSIAPAMTMRSWRSAACFLLSYAFGTMAAMSLAAASVGEISRRLGLVAEDPDLPRRLGLASSVLAALIGSYWLVALLLKSRGSFFLSS